MLALHDIHKVYTIGNEKTRALKGISLNFRKNEFVSILGPSGCGKTTLLNIIGGLDQYTYGDLEINGVSTKKYKDHDWDTYRNHSIGFVFQSYNLIPHQSILSNVELALTISGVSKKERRKRAAEALQKVGLSNHLNKKPTQMSGGQMQRVAIARALVNNPDILLADEPTGALDSKTSIQIMDLLKTIAKDRLVIMVTHNPELAEQYSTRIIKLLDGKIVSDSMPYTDAEVAEEKKEVEEYHNKKTSMSFFTALSLSLKNLLTKKTRTFLTSFAGSIGIIGIALILSVSEGVNNYIADVQRDTLSSYPISIQAENADYSSLISTLMGQANDKESHSHDKDAVYSNSILYEMMNSMNSITVQKNNLTKFKKFLDEDEEINKHISAIKYSYDADMTIYTQDENGTIIRANLSSLFASMSNTSGQKDNAGSSQTSSMSNYSSNFASMNAIEEMISGNNGELISPIIKEQYEVIYGHWPQNYNEMILVVDENNEISDLALYALGLKSSEDFKKAVRSYFLGEQIDISEERSWTYEEICNHEYRLILPVNLYEKGLDGTYTDISKTSAGLSYIYNEKGVPLKVVGIIRGKEDAVSTMLSGALCYTTKLTEYLFNETANSILVKEQLENPTIDAFNKLPFATEDNTQYTIEAKRTYVNEYLASLTDAQKCELLINIKSIPTPCYIDNQVTAFMQAYSREEIIETFTSSYAEQVGTSEESIKNYLASLSEDDFNALIKELFVAQLEEQYKKAISDAYSVMPQEAILAQYAEWVADIDDNTVEYIFDEFVPSTVSESSYEDNLKKLGYVSLDTPSSIRIYSKTFEDKDSISEGIARYNKSITDENDKIQYTDYIALLMSSVSTIINAISYVLVAFVSISLIVSSIMIGIITYISVLERTKEIGILRAIGASKRDISRVFNAETLIVGFVAGAIGILVSLLLILPINAIIHYLSGIGNLSAVLPWKASIILVLISMGLTLIAGLVPSRIAAKKDPVESLRTD